MTRWPSEVEMQLKMARHESVVCHMQNGTLKYSESAAHVQTQTCAQMLNDQDLTITNVHGRGEHLELNVSFAYGCPRGPL